MPQTILALGANVAGEFGGPLDTLRYVVDHLQLLGVRPVRLSKLYDTTPLGQRSAGRQARYLNAVLLCRTTVAPMTLLLRLKRLERCAGRRTHKGSGSRPLDLDIVDMRGTLIGRRRGRRVRGGLIIPHPEAHRRAFVLAPLVDVAPHWHHVPTGLTARQLLNRLPRRPYDAQVMLESEGRLCDQRCSDECK